VKNTTERKRPLVSPNKQNNPWELLVIAALFFIPGLTLILQKHASVLIQQKSRGLSLHTLSDVTVLSPHVAHIFGMIALTASVGVVFLYFWTRRAIQIDEARRKRFVDDGDDA
jgi:hypothetical protein